MPIIELETKSGNIIEFDVETTRIPEHIGGSYEGRDFEQISEAYSIDKIYRNNIDVTKRIERLSPKAYMKIDEKINESN